MKDENDLPLRQHSLCIFDVFKAHQKEELRELLKKKNIHMVYVPASCTDRLQPLDLSVNAAFKLNMKNSFEDWYSHEVAKQLQEKSPDEVDINMALSVVKPLHAKWLVSVISKLEKDSAMIKRGWTEAGII